ncbi:peptidoglycan-associated lipoprotein [Magnetospirillum moscoviense]|uniref:Peptidoglycan-associated lipoprotein n=2 Tax=Magnetospirillum moscoviense TaxID=1437059 RepID=A0A178MRV6_9PROT|nr:peptidoglycan-associated lipoprotein [Magnetospirillum moscoviense]
MRFAAAALATTGAGCEMAEKTEPQHHVVYGAPPPRPSSALTPGSVEDFVANAGDRVFFDVDKASLRADAKATLGKQAAWLKRYSVYTLTIEGHADERGTREYNLALGSQRAEAIKAFLVASGVSSHRIKTVSYGKERPVALGSNEAAWSQNRRGTTALDR